MKRLPIMMISGVCLLAAGCGAPSSGALGPAPTATAAASSPAVPTGSGTASAAPSPSGQQPTATPAQGPVREIGLQAWFSRNGKLFVTKRTVPATTGIGQAALDRMLTGPSAAEYAAGLRSRIPAGTTVLGVRISAGIATVDLSSSFESAASPSAMPLRIAQVVYTLTQFPTVVSGTADVFEATVSVRIGDSAGHEIARTFTTASCGTGCRGDYSVTVSYSVPRTQPGTIEVFESSAKDGQPVNVQLIPVTLAP